jgi:excisionase family DNA binding protein
MTFSIKSFTLFLFNKELMEMNLSNEDGTWPNETAANYIGVTGPTMRVWVHQRRVPFVRVGRLVRFRKCDLDEWLDSHAVEPTA